LSIGCSWFDLRKNVFLLVLFYLLETNLDDDDEEPFLDSTGCNKMIMIVTDGASETALSVFQNRNWYPNNVSTCHRIEVKNKNANKILFIA
jgi:hypothetical protein